MADNYDDDKPRRGPGRRWGKGVSGNPNGRPPGAAGLAKFIREETKDFRELASIALSIARGRKKFEEFVGPQAIKVKRRPNATERMTAVKWLADRGAGTAQAFIELTGPGGGPLQVALENLEKLSDDDLNALEGIAQRALGSGVSAGEGEGGEGEAGERVREPRGGSRPALPKLH